MLCYCYGSVSDQLGPSAFNKFDFIWFDKMQSYEYNAIKCELVNVFEEHSIYIISAISIDS